MLLFLWRLIYGKTCEHQLVIIDQLMINTGYGYKHVYVMKCKNCGALKNHTVRPN